MYLFYLFALIPVLIGAGIWLFDRKVVWGEWAFGALLAFLVAGISHYAAIAGMTRDIETFSGQITHTIFHPEWVEEYQVPVYKTVSHTDSKGNTYTTTEFSHYETHYRTHHQKWVAYSNIETEYDISQDKFNEICSNFGGKIITEKPHKPGFYSGDPNIYRVNDEFSDKITYPITDLRTWENRIKAAPSVFSFAKVPEKMPVFDWPENPNPWRSDRLIGRTGRITIEGLDRLNAYLGPRKHINIILVGFGNKDSSMASWQEAKWLRGKKNDVVICFGSNNGEKVDWVRVFGWTETQLALRNLETIFLNSKLDDNILIKIREEIVRNYSPKDWSKFDYISLEPTTTAIVLFLAFLFLTQAGIYVFFHHNDITKDTIKNLKNHSNYRYYYQSYRR